MAQVEAACKVRLGAASTGQSADGQVLEIRPVNETIPYDTMLNLWDRNNLNTWYSDWPQLSVYYEPIVSQGRAIRVQWLTDPAFEIEPFAKIPTDAGASLNWGIQDLRRHTIFVVDNWPDTLKVGLSDDGTEFNTITFEYAGNIPSAIEDQIRDETLWNEPWWQNQASGTGFDFNTYAIVDTQPVDPPDIL
jgi:hypothetical protein